MGVWENGNTHLKMMKTWHTVRSDDISRDEGEDEASSHYQSTTRQLTAPCIFNSQSLLSLYIYSYMYVSVCHQVRRFKCVIKMYWRF